MADKASTHDLEKISNAVETVYQDIVAGTTPGEAVIKTARAENFNNEWTARLCELTNRVLAVHHIESNDWDKRAGVYPLIDPEEVVQELFPTTVTAVPRAKAASVELTPGRTYRYADTEPLVKAASKEARYLTEDELREAAGTSVNVQDTLQQVFQVREELRGAIRDGHAEEADICHTVGEAAKAAAQAIKTSGVDFADVEERVVARFHKEGAVTMEIIAGHLPGVSRFTGSPRTFTTSPWDTAPYRQIDSALRVVKQAALRALAHETMIKLARRVDGAITFEIRRLIGPSEKTAALGTSSIAGLGGMMALKDKLAPPPSKSPEDIQMHGLEHEDYQLARTLQSTQAMADALSDEVIQRYPLNEIMQSYNRLSELAPRSIGYSAVLIPTLRQMLEHPDKSPFEVSQTQQVETSLAQHQSPTTLA